MSKKPPFKRVSDIEFVTAFLKCSSAAELMNLLGITKWQLLAKQFRLRNGGVKLPKMVTKISNPVDKDGLNKIISSHK